MRISGTEPSSVILIQTKKFKIWELMPKNCLNKVKPKMLIQEAKNYMVHNGISHTGVINQNIMNENSIFHVQTIDHHVYQMHK